MDKANCYDLGVIQAFTDGEIASDLQEKVIGHIALCDSCAMLLAETEEESAFAFSLLNEQCNVLVPTERLRTKVFESIKETEEKANWWYRLTVSLGLADGVNLLNPQLVAFASVVLFVSALAIGVNFYKPMPSGSEVVFIDQSPNKTRTIAFPDIPVGGVTADPKENSKSSDIEDDEYPVQEEPDIPSQNSNSFRAMKAGGINNGGQTRIVRERKISLKPREVSPKSGKVNAPIAPPTSPNLAGEDSYLQTISTLSRTVDNNKDISLRPTERVAFEKDMAFVDDAIKKLKNEVRKNPNNQAAREVLRSSYQNKIDLLNSVAEKTELMASIQ